MFRICKFTINYSFQLTKNLFVGRIQINLNEVDSTNNYARQLVRDKTPIEGTVIVAKDQTNGRGQRSNLWVAEPYMNLTCSYVLKPVFLAAKDQFILSAAVALAVFETISALLPKENVKVKWPNDVLVNGKKIAGILIENMLRGSNLETSIIGIGINVNQVQFPAGFNPTSIKLNAASDVKIEAVLDLLSAQLERFYLQLREGKLDTLLESFNSNLFERGILMNLQVNDKLESVMIVGVEKTGELRLEHSNGTQTLHQHYEINWLL